MRNIVISGSASGIGLATKELLESQGDKVIGIDLKDADIEADLSDLAQRKSAIEQVIEVTGNSVDAMVLCAGLSGLFAPADTTLSVNYFGSVDLFDGLLPAMQGRPNACAIGLVSNSAQFGIDYDDPRVITGSGVWKNLKYGACLAEIVFVWKSKVARGARHTWQKIL